METIEVSYKRTVYQSAAYGVSIALYGSKEEDNWITVTGQMLPTIKNLKYRFTGTWVNHPKYGRQFQATGYEQIIGSSAKAIEEYLASAIKGCGKVTAHAIVNKFGEDTIRVMETNFQALASIKGLGGEKLRKMEESFLENRASMSIAISLAKHGISAKLAVKAYQMFKEKTQDIIENKPYMLSLVPGITFPVADNIGPDTEEYEKSYDRFRIAAMYVLYQNEQNGMKAIIGNRTSGSLAMDKDDFGKAMLSLLFKKTINGNFICDYTVKMIRERELIYRSAEGNNLIYLPGIYDMEKFIAENIYRLAKNGKRKNIDNLDEMIAKAERSVGIQLGQMQKQAVRNTFTNGLSIIVGPPGSGKTTTIEVIAWIYKKLYNDNLTFLAPTGKAAARIKEASGYNATTIHSALSIGTDIINSVPDDIEEIFDNGLLGVDEMSMLDTRTACRLFGSISDNNIVILSGDDNQLQSVGAGAVLRDMIDSNCLPVTYLDTVYRSAEGGEIYENANRMRKGNAELVYGDEFHFTECSDTKEMEKKVIQCYLKQIDKYGIQNVMLIAPFKEHDCGVNELNKQIQQILNPSDVNDKVFTHIGGYYRINDLVMHLKNNESVVNGDIGLVSDIVTLDGELKLVVNYPGGVQQVYGQDNIDEITLAYAYTVHKSQGSEAKCVITVMHSMHSIMQKRNILYTAITRGKKEVCLFGELTAVGKAIRTEDKAKRNTSLKQLLRVVFGEFISIGYVAG